MKLHLAFITLLVLYLHHQTLGANLETRDEGDRGREKETGGEGERRGEGGQGGHGGQGEEGGQLGQRVQ